MASSCSSPKPALIGVSHVATDGPTTGSAVDYAFDSLDARAVSGRAFVGKVTLIAFVTTYDLACQAQVNYMVAMSKHDGEKVNYAVVALEEKGQRELVEVYRTNLKVTFPVALGDTDTIKGGGPFGDVHQIPTLVMLDKGGHLVWKKTGLSKPEEIRAAMPR